MKKILCLSIGAMTYSAQAATGFSFFYKMHDLLSPDTVHTSVQIGNQVVECLIDTGARFTLAKESILTGYAKVGEVSGGGISGNERVADLVQVPLHMGDWVHPTGIIGRTDQIPDDCLMGNDFFLEKEFSIDFSEKRFTDENSFTGATFPLNKYLSDRGGHFGFDVEVGDERVPTLFDTGATNTVFDIRFVEAHPQDFEFIKEIDVEEGSNQTIKAGVYRLKAMKMGPVQDRDIQVYVVSLQYLQAKIPGIQAVIGLGQMTKYKWYLNNKTSIWGIY